ncbi:hypothetical protein LL3_00885 [Bacillus amyloliquefaciens LL3]|nr:hypothetical protein LL3_00885 [Bacillus amyloliquefaciens LL3]
MIYIITSTQRKKSVGYIGIAIMMLLENGVRSLNRDSKKRMKHIEPYWKSKRQF